MQNTKPIPQPLRDEALGFQSRTKYSCGSEDSGFYTFDPDAANELVFPIDPLKKATTATITFTDSPMVIEALGAELLVGEGKIVRVLPWLSNASATESRLLYFDHQSPEILFTIDQQPAEILRFRCRVVSRGADAGARVIDWYRDEMCKFKESALTLANELDKERAARVQTEGRWKSLLEERDAGVAKILSLLDRVEEQRSRLEELDKDGPLTQENLLRTELLRDFGIKLPRQRYAMLSYLLEQWGQAAEDRDRLEDELQILRGQLEQNNANLNQVVHSRSWKITSPIRKFGQLLRSIRRRLRS